MNRGSLAWFAFFVGVSLVPAALASKRWHDPYIGQWSNGRGETLVIGNNTIKFANDKAVNYRDITRVTNGKEFQLEITSEGKLNYLAKCLHISLSDKSDEMKMILYNSRKDMEGGENSQGQTTWHRNKQLGYQ